LNEHFLLKSAYVTEEKQVFKVWMSKRGANATGAGAGDTQVGGGGKNRVKIREW
jgi:hypothetical protein